MRKSARVLGLELGMSARDVNALLKDHGYLEGGPGAYGVTPKGWQFAHEHDHHRGTGGSPWYNRHWTERTWDEDVLDALAVDMAQAAPSPEIEADEEAGPDDDCPPSDDRANDDTDIERGRSPNIDSAWVWVGVGVAALVAAAVAAPHVKKLWRKVATRRSEAVEDRDDTPAPPHQAPATPGSTVDRMPPHPGGPLVPGHGEATD